MPNANLVYNVYIVTNQSVSAHLVDRWSQLDRTVRSRNPGQEKSLDGKVITNRTCRLNSPQ